MGDGQAPRRVWPVVLVVFGIAASLRLAVVAWAPGVPESDGRAYHQYALMWLESGAYQNVDGSPGIRWMPGWPTLLASLYRVFGELPRAGMLANALFDAGTAAVTALLGIRLFRRRVGVAAGLIYALWPGMLAYSATLFSEPLFGLLFSSALLALATPADRTPRAGRAVAAGLAFGLCAYVKSEPLALLPALLFAIWRSTPEPSAFARRALAFVGVTGALLLPWTIRNYHVFDRFIPTSASGGVVVHLANHEGARGRQDFARNRQLSRLYRGETMALTTIQRNDAGWGEAWRFAREHPGEQLRLVGRKLRVTYGGDTAALRAIRGRNPEPHIDLVSFGQLSRWANTYWFVALLCAALGAAGWRRWPRGVAPLLFGPLATWWGLHAIFLGGERFHVPEIPIYAILAGVGLSELAERAQRRLPARILPPFARPRSAT